MKKMKAVVAMMLSLCLLFAAASTCKLTVEAEGATTYTLKYVDNDWHFQPNYPWDDNVMERELYYMTLDFKDGDKIVIADDSQSLELKIDKRIGNVTVEKGSNVVIYGTSIDEAYVLNGSSAAFNGNVTKAGVYDDSIANFNNNVGYLEIYAQKYPLKADVNVLGTVDHLVGRDNNDLHYELYNFAANTLRIGDGDVDTDEAYFSDEPGAAPTTTTPAAPATTTTTTTTNTSASDELDEVPKTGDVTNYYWMLMVAALSLVTGLYLKKKNA